MNRYVGYARISTPQQSIERQIRNILAAYPQSEIIREVFTGTKFQGRREFEKLLKKLNAGDTIIFDSVSRMSRDAEEGFTMYEDLFSKGINLVFLKEPHIKTQKPIKVRCKVASQPQAQILTVFWKGSINICSCLPKNRSDLLLNSQKKRFRISGNVLKKECRPQGFPVNRSDRLPVQSL